MPSNVSYGNVPAPRGWLGVAFLGVWLYLISQIMQLFSSTASEAMAVSEADLLPALAMTSGLGQILVLSGLVAALWRSNLAAGLTPSGVRGLVMGSAGVGVLVLFEIAQLFDFLRVRLDPIPALLKAAPTGSIMGIALAFAGLASLAVGLTQVVGLFERAPEEAKPIPPTPEKTA